MKKITSLLAFFAIAFSGFNLAAQGSEVIQIGGVNIDNKLATPITVNNIVKSSSKAKGEWLAVTVKFKVNDFAGKPNALDDGKWIDKMSITWKGLFQGRDQKYKRTQKVVNYESVTAGEYYATILVDPHTVNRYLGGQKNASKNLALYAVFKINGKTQMGSKIYIQGGKRVKAFSAPIGEKSFDAEALDSVDGILMSKAESPWVATQTDIFPKISIKK